MIDMVSLLVIIVSVLIAVVLGLIIVSCILWFLILEKYIDKFKEWIQK